MKTSLRLAFTALAISFVTVAASGAPLPFFDHDQPHPAIVREAPLPGADAGHAPARPVLTNYLSE